MEKKQHSDSQGTNSLSHLEVGEIGVVKTFILACRVRLYNLFKGCQNIFCYYLWHPKFLAADAFLLAQYFFKSPYTLVREHDSEHPDDPVGPYGETDFCEFDAIFTAFDIPATHSVADLGSGRGRLAFFLKLVRCQRYVVAYEKLSIFVQRAERVRKILGISDVSFHQEDWHTADLRAIDVIYYYNLSPGRSSAQKLASLPKTTKIITIGSWLEDELPGAFHLEKKIPVRFIWGTTEAFLQTPLGYTQMT
jgi:hypothetical protein